MRILLALVVVASVSRVSAAQSEVGAPASLRGAVQLGQMVVVTEDSGRETTGVVREVTDSTLTLDGRAFPARSVYALRRTDPLGNGTLAGVGVAMQPRACSPVGVEATTTRRSVVCVLPQR